MKSLRVLYAIFGKADPTFGGGKVYHGMAEAMSSLGWDCRIADSESILKGESFLALHPAEVEQRLRAFIQQEAANYDVVEYDCSALPFPREDFPSKPLMVARSVLLPLHLETIRFPFRWTMRRILRHIIHGVAELNQTKRLIAVTRKTVCEADCVNVSNQDDSSELVRKGVSPERIITLPYGLSEAEFDEFSKVNVSEMPRTRVLFLGTFDWRKGAADMPSIFSEIAQARPDVDFLMLGTKSIFHTVEAVRGEFPDWIRGRIEVHPRFDRSELASLLEGCAVGVFPSYLEGCPFAVLEQIAAGIPTVAYKAPGPPMLLPESFLVPVGDRRAMARRVLDICEDHVRHMRDSRALRERAGRFAWASIAKETDNAYRAAILRRKLVEPTGWA